MSRTPFQLRMDDDRLERLRRVAAKMQMSKAEIIEAAIDVRLDMLEGYVKLDTAPPKTAAGVKRQVEALKAGSVKMKPNVKHLALTDDLRSNLSAVRRVRGWDAEGKEVY